MAKNVKWIKLIGVLAFLFFQSFNALAQQESIEKQEVDSTWWNESTQDVNYFEERRVVDPTKKKEHNRIDWTQYAFLKYFVLLLIAGVLIYFLYRIYGQAAFEFSASKRSKHLLNLTEEELDERFLELDLLKMLETAIKKKNWKMVVRLRFLQVLKKLVDNEVVNWHADLTNRQISYQLKLGDMRTGFNSLITIYEMAWYSNADVNEQFYNNVKPKFDNYDKQLVTHG